MTESTAAVLFQKCITEHWGRVAIFVTSNFVYFSDTIPSWGVVMSAASQEEIVSMVNSYILQGMSREDAEVRRACTERFPYGCVLEYMYVCKILKVNATWFSSALMVSE